MRSKPGGGGGAGSGPTAAAAAAAAQKQNSHLQRLETEISNIVDHFTQLILVSRVNDPPVRKSQDSFRMEVRAARMTQSADSLLKLVSELKQTAMFLGFSSLNENVDRRIALFNQEAENTERLLERIGEQAAASLKELETHYYSLVTREVSNLWWMLRLAGLAWSDGQRSDTPQYYSKAAISAAS